MSGAPTVSCSWVRARLELLPGANLPAATATALRAHLFDCTRCRARLHPVLQAHRALLAEVPADALPSGFHPEVAVDRGFFAAMHRAIMAQVRNSPAPRRAARSGARVAAAAAVLFLCGFGLTALLPRSDANLLQRAPLEAGRPTSDAGPSALTVTVSHEPRCGLMGRRKALRELKLAVEVGGAGRRR